MSPGSAHKSLNLGGSHTADKQCSFGDTRVFFFVAVTRGVFGVKVFLPKDAFPGETPGGARVLVKQLPALLQKMLGPGAKLPRTFFLIGGQASTTVSGERSLATTRQLVVLLASHLGLALIPRRAPALSHLTLGMCSCTKQPYPGCAVKKNRHGQGSHGKRHHEC